MEEQELKQFLKENYGPEKENVEYKAWTRHMNISGKPGDDIGSYVSGIANSGGGVLVLGVEDETYNILGIDYKKNIKGVELTILRKTYPNHEIYIEEFITSDTKKKVWIIHIKKHPLGQEVVFENIAYQRNKDSLIKLTEGRKREIRMEILPKQDWSAQPCKGTTLKDLDDIAIQFLRKKLSEVKNNDKWLIIPLKNLLNSIGLLTDGIPNNTCILFLGKREISDKYFREKNKISWRYFDEANDIEERLNIDKQKGPLILTLQKIKEKINRFNTTLKDLDLFRKDIRQYDEKAIEEMLVNSLAHRDWTIDLWNEVVQTPYYLEFRNPGIFRANLEKVLFENKAPEYINPAMSEFFQHLNLMEKERGGLQKVYKSQLSRGVRISFKNEDNRVDFRLWGKIENEDFAKLVLNNTNITLEDLLYLDKIVSGYNSVGKDISKDIASNLKNKGYIEIRGTRYQKCYISKNLSEKIGKTGEYTKKKGIERKKQEELILQHIEDFGKIRLSNLEDLFPELSYNQRKKLLKGLKDKGKIQLIKEGKRQNWYYIIN